jgi:PAS domain S-box-containing protein
MPTNRLTDGLRETLSLFDGTDRGTPFTTSEVADRLGVGRRSTYDRLERLVEEDRLETKKVGARGRVWWRPGPSARERKTSPEADRPAADSLVDVLDGAEVGVFVLDEDFEVAWINDATERYFGLDRDRVVGRDKRALIEERITSVIDESTAFAETVLATYDDNSYAEQFECRVIPGEGREERWLEHRSKPIETGRYAGGRVELYYDVTERKRSTQARRETEQRFRSLVDAVEEYAIFVLDAEGRVRTWNEGAKRIKGYETEEILGEHLSTFYTDADRAAGIPEANLATAAAGGITKDEGWRLRKDGSKFWAHVTVAPIHDEDGDVEGYAKVTHDLTDRRERERAIRRERDLLEQVLETSPIGIGVFHPDGSVDRMNVQTTELLGLTETEAENYTLEDRELFDPSGEPLSFEETPLGRVIEAGEPVADREIRIEEPGGETRWVSINAAPLTAEDGELERVVTTATDVTELKEQASRLERQRDELEAELEGVFKRVRDGFFGLDTELRFTYVNDRAADLLRRSPDDLAGEHIWDTFEPGPEAEAAFDEALRTQEPVTFEEYYEPLETWFENRVYPSETGLSVYFRDVSERKERERALEESERRYRTLAENFPNGAVVMFDEDLRYTLIQGDLPKELGVEDEWVGGRLDEVLPPEARDAFVEHYRAALEGEATAFETELAGRILQVRAVPIRDENGDVFAGMGMSQDVTERVERERELDRRRERLTALNNLYDVVHDITEAVIEQSTRDEIEEIVCRRLAESDSYEFVWFSEVDPKTRSIEPKVEAGVEGYLDEISLSADLDDPTGRGPTGRAVQTQEMQVVRNVFEDPDFEPWRESAEKYGYRSSAAIPVTHQGTLYGVFGVYTARKDGFTDEEREVIGQLGEVIGHAIAAVERKRVLMSDEVVELELQIRDVFEAVDGSHSAEGAATFDRTVPAGDGVFLVYGTATGDAMDVVEAVADSEAVPHWESVSVLGTDDGEARFELKMTDPPLISTVADHGGYVQEARLEDGDYYTRIHLAPNADVRHVSQRIREAYPTIELLSQRQVSVDRQSIGQLRGSLFEDLTERQRSAIEAAYRTGYFSWPRESTGEEIAQTLDLSSPTFHQHLRVAQEKLLTALFEDEWG